MNGKRAHQRGCGASRTQDPYDSSVPHTDIGT